MSISVSRIALSPDTKKEQKKQPKQPITPPPQKQNLDVLDVDKLEFNDLHSVFGGYTPTSIQSDTLSELRSQAEQRYEGFKQLIQSILTEQGVKYNVVLFGKKLNVTPEASAKAKEVISEGGEYSVDAVAMRIMNMAKALSGGDSSKIGVLKQAVLDGFAAAGKVFGKELPQISKDTYNVIMKRFDAWENPTKEAAD